MMPGKTTKHFLRSVTTFVMTVLLTVALTGCHHIDNKRLPVVPVNVVFSNAGMWTLYGVEGAMNYRYFIKTSKERVPADFPYPVSASTGFGGILLVSDYNGMPVAYDLSCPVECRMDVRVHIDNDTHYAVCDKCGSAYSVFESYGHPVSGPAAERGYGLQIYSVVPGTTDYFVIRR